MELAGAGRGLGIVILNFTYTLLVFVVDLLFYLLLLGVRFILGKRYEYSDWRSELIREATGLIRGRDNETQATEFDLQYINTFSHLNTKLDVNGSGFVATIHKLVIIYILKNHKLINISKNFYLCITKQYYPLK